MKTHAQFIAAGAVAASLFSASLSHAVTFLTPDKKWANDLTWPSLYEYYGEPMASGSYRTQSMTSWSHDGRTRGYLADPHSDTEAIVQTEAWVSLFGASKRVAFVSAMGVADSAPTSSFTLAQGGFSVMGTSITGGDKRNYYPTVNNLSNVLSSNKSVSLTFFDAPYSFMLGPIPVTLRGYVGGTAGGQVFAQGSLGVSNVLQRDRAVVATTATGRLWGSFSATAGIPGVFGLGAAVTVDFLTLTAGPSAHTTRERVGSANQHMYCTQNQNGLTLSSLRATLTVFADLLGAHYSEDVLSTPQAYPLWEGMLWDTGEQCTVVEADIFW